MATKETQKLINRARSYADQVFIPRHRRRYEALLEQERRRDPTLHRDLIRSRARTLLRREFPYEWGQLRTHALVVVRREAGWVDGKLSRRPELQIPCPSCGAEAGHGCRSMTPSRSKRSPHKARLNDWKQGLTEQAAGAA